MGLCVGWGVCAAGSGQRARGTGFSPQAAGPRQAGSAARMWEDVAQASDVSWLQIPRFEWSPPGKAGDRGARRELEGVASRPDGKFQVWQGVRQDVRCAQAAVPGARPHLSGPRDGGDGVSCPESWGRKHDIKGALSKARGRWKPWARGFCSSADAVGSRQQVGSAPTPAVTQASPGQGSRPGEGTHGGCLRLGEVSGSQFRSALSRDGGLPIRCPGSGVRDLVGTCSLAP